MDHQDGPAPALPARRLVLCLDGTWNNTYARRYRTDGTAVLKPSNVLKLCRAVLPWGPRGGREQIAYYDVGVGSLGLYPGLPNRVLHWADRMLGGLWGAGFEGNVEEALHFLVLNHRPGDQVFLFGFSRGAATARALTRFLDWAGGLPVKRDAYYLPELFRAYVVSRGARDCAAVLEEINARRAAERRPRPPIEPLRPVPIEFLGVWDTVMALGSRFGASDLSTSAADRRFHVDLRPALCVRHARQALAIDEARDDFRPEVWQGAAAGQSLEQRWFAGVHSNVGGGYVNDGLANLAFRWILGEAVALGLEVDPRYVAFFRGFAQDRLYRSESLLYRLLDGFRLRFGRGRRRLVDGGPEARLELHPSVIHRLRADPADPRFPGLRSAYRPPNLLAYLARQPDLDGYLEGLGLRPEQRQLPADVLREIERLRPPSGPSGRERA